MRMFRRSAALAFAALTAVSGLVRADSLDFVPQTALFAVKVNDLAGTAQKVAAYSQRLGVTAFMPEMADPLTFLKEQVQLPAGALKENGDAAMVFIKPAAGESDDKSFFIVLPVEDYEKFLSAFEKVGTEGEVTRVKMPKSGSDGFIAHWGDYAVMSPTSALISSKPTDALKAPARTAEQLKNQDIVLWANVTTIRELVAPELAKAREELAREVTNAPENLRPVATAAGNKLLDLADAILRDAESGTVGLTLRDDGLAATALGEFKADSYVGGFVGRVKNTDQPLLIGLPDRGYLFYAGVVGSPELLDTIFADVIDPIVAQLPADEKFAFIPPYLTAIKDFGKKAQTVSYGLQTPEGPIGTSETGLVRLAMVATGDGPGMKQSFSDMYKYEQQLSALFMPADSDVKMSSTRTEGAKTIGGVTFDEVSTAVTGEGPMANQQKQAMRLIYGSDTVRFYTGAIDTAAITFVGLTDDEVGRVVELTKTGDSPLSKLQTVAFVAKNLPPTRAAEYYVSADQIAILALQAAQQFGAIRRAPEVPSGLPPLGFSMGTEGPSLRLDAFVPLDTIEAMVSVGIQAAQQQGGRRGGGGGL